ncbi:hypothetical protein Tco_1371664, partial [Tanacetum coccineum]
VTEEGRYDSQEAKANGKKAISDGWLLLYKECLYFPCFLYVRSKIDKFLDTATVFIKMKKPNAAIWDADVALRVVLTF